MFIDDARARTAKTKGRAAEALLLGMIVVGVVGFMAFTVAHFISEAMSRTAALFP